MLMMRLQRTGRRNDPAFRVVVTDSRNGPKAGKHVDILGAYNPKMNTVQIDGEKAKEWIAKGVQVSDTVHNILVSQKFIEGKKKNVLPKKSPIVSEAAEEETPAEETKEEAPEEVKEEAPAEEEKTEESAPEAPAEDAPAEEAPEEVKEEAPVEEAAAEEKKD